MAPSKKAALAKKIKHLELRLAPLVPLPEGPPHEAFPRTILAYHLLTEEELDSIAHYYHQSTPGLWTFQYPACMNWDKEHLKRKSIDYSRRQSNPSANSEWWSDFLPAAERNSISPKTPTQSSPQTRRWSTTLTDKERIAIKRRKVGKFIGLVGMETPIDEIEGRIQRSFERAQRLAQEDLRRMEAYELGRSKS